MAEFAGVSEQALRAWMRLPGFPRAPDGSVCLWDLAIWKHRYDKGGDVSEEIPDGVDSPALEEFRRARAEQEKIKLLRMQGEFVSLEDVHAAMAETASVMKSTAERIMRDAGNDVALMLNEAWDEVERRLEHLFKDGRGGGEDDSSNGAAE